MIFHLRHAPLGESEMTLFWTTFDSHAVVPWLMALVITVVAFAIMRRNMPTLRAAWHRANSLEEESA